ncbi:MAG: GMC family oxidoreductase, partial [Thermodesulfobacteriota bacterium]
SVELEKGKKNYYEQVNDMIHYDTVSPVAMNKNAQLFLKGVHKIPGGGEHSECNMRNTNVKFGAAGHAGRPPHELTCVGCGFCVLGCRYDRKQTPLITYMPAIIQNSLDGLNGNEVQIYKNAQVSKVTHDNDKVTGVKVGRRTIKAKTVVVSAGAISSAQLLLKSGLGPKNHYLGKELSLHPSPLIYGLYKKGSTAKKDMVHADWGIPMAASYTKHQFPNKSNTFPDGFGYILESIYNHPAATAMTFSKSTMKKRMRQFSKLMNISVILHDQPVGEITEKHGVITSMKYKLHDIDKTKLIHAIKTSAKILFEAGADEVFTNHEDELVFRDESDLKKLNKKNCPLEPGKILLATAHPQGGCKIGNTGNGVVDSTGMFQGIKNLFVCDASLFPTSLGVNPQLTIMAMATMIGEKIAERVEG